MNGSKERVNDDKNWELLIKLQGMSLLKSLLPMRCKLLKSVHQWAKRTLVFDGSPAYDGVSRQNVLRAARTKWREKTLLPLSIHTDRWALSSVNVNSIKHVCTISLSCHWSVFVFLLKGYCYNGECPTHDDQCKDLWGRGMLQPTCNLFADSFRRQSSNYKIRLPSWLEVAAWLIQCLL